MSIADKLLTIANNTPRVCEKLKVSKTSVSGSVIAVNDVNETVHDVDIKLTSNTVTEFLGITVSRYGKNLVNYEDVVNGYKTTFAKIDNGFVVEGEYYVPIKNIPVTKNTDYVLSFNYAFKKEGATNPAVQVWGNNENTNILSKTTFLETNTKVTLRFNSGATDEITLAFYSNNNKVTFTNILLEFGTVATAYEPYKELQTKLANKEGTVNGITSLSPNMTLTTNNNGVIINAEYINKNSNVDTEKITALNEAFANAKAVIQELRI